jgi:hypothetical protein
LPLQAQGEFAQVKEKLESSLQLSGQPVKRGTMAHKHIIYMMLAESAGQLRDADSLPRYASLLEELAIRDGHQPYLAVAHRAWGIFHRLQEEYPEAESRLNHALTLFEELEAHWQIGRTLVEFGELALARQDSAGASDCFSRAMQEFELINAMPEIERLRHALESLEPPVS